MMTKKKLSLTRMAFDAAMFTAVIASAVYIASIEAAANERETTINSVYPDRQIAIQANLKSQD